jgi:LysR family transcriptional regulator, transcriptional activator of nhaA
MEWLNYHHLLYFWVVARAGSIARASEQLHLAQPTISSQIGRLEKSLGAELFQKSGRGLQLTDTGRTVFRYADEIFALGRELTDAVKGRPTGQPLRFTVGVPDVLPKLIVHRLLKPAFDLPDQVRLVVREGKFDSLLGELATHELDLVLSDCPVPPHVSVKAYNHLLGECGIAFFASIDIAKKYRKGFPRSIDGAPMLAPGDGTAVRRSLEQWFDDNAIRPVFVAEFQDSALLKVFGQEGLGVFPAPAAIKNEIERQYRVEHVGTIEDARERYFAVSVERRLKHPAVLAISTAAKTELFSQPNCE